MSIINVFISLSQRHTVCCVLCVCAVCVCEREGEVPKLTTLGDITVLPTLSPISCKTPRPLSSAPGVSTIIMSPLNLKVGLIVQQVLVGVTLCPCLALKPRLSHINSSIVPTATTSVAEAPWGEEYSKYFTHISFSIPLKSTESSGGGIGVIAAI